MSPALDRAELNLMAPKLYPHAQGRSESVTMIMVDFKFLSPLPLTCREKDDRLDSILYLNASDITKIMLMAIAR